jgi:hypothetical protein
MTDYEAFPAPWLDLPIDASSLAELTAVGWHETTCPLCASPAGAIIGGRALTWFVCATCQRFGMTWSSTAMIRDQTSAFRKALSGHARSSDVPPVFSEDLAWAVGHGGETEN